MLVHLTGRPDIIAARLQARDGPTSSLDRVRALIGAYHSTFAVLSGTAPIVTADATDLKP